MINTVTGFTQTIPFDFIDKVHLSTDGTNICSVRGQHDILIVQQHTFNGEAFVEARSDTLVLADHISGPVKAVPETMLELPDGMVLNLSMFLRDRALTGTKSVASMFCLPPVSNSQSLQVSLSNGVIWQDNSGTTAKLRRLTPLSDGRAKIVEIIADGKEATRD